MLKTFYIIAILNCVFNAFARYSKGALFEDKRTWVALHGYILIALLAISVIKYGWIQILWILLIDFLCYFPCAYILSRIFKR